MRILVCGATGFIGRYVCAALTAAGHDVLPGVRCPSAGAEIAIDFERDVDVAAWLPRLAGVDAVINAVGAIGASALDRIQRDTPIALFDACAKQGVQRVVQISALGAEEPEPITAFLRTKREADLHLMRLPLGWSVLRPSLVAGAEGASSRVFRMLASLPVVPLPGDGRQQVQPVSVEDVASAAVALLAPGAPHRVVVDAVGPERLAYRDMLARYRTQMGLPPARWLPVPRMLLATLVRLSAPLSRGADERRHAADA